MKTTGAAGGFHLDSYVLSNFADLDRVRPFRTVRDFKGDLVAFAKFVKRDADELVGVEKEISLLSLSLDEPETLIGETGNCSCLHSNEKKLRK